MNVNSGHKGKKKEKLQKVKIAWAIFSGYNKSELEIWYSQKTEGSLYLEIKKTTTTKTLSQRGNKI